MGISLSQETEKRLEERVKNGAYRTADDLILAALGALDELDDAGELDEETLDAIDRAEGQIERGEVHDWKDIREQVRGRLMGNG